MLKTRREEAKDLVNELMINLDKEEEIKLKNTRTKDYVKTYGTKKIKGYDYVKIGTNRYTNMLGFDYVLAKQGSIDYLVKRSTALVPLFTAGTLGYMKVLKPIEDADK